MTEATISTITKHLLGNGNSGFKVTYEVMGSSYISFQLINTMKPDDNLTNMFNSKHENLIVIDSIKSGVGRKPQTDFYEIVIKPVLNYLNMTHKYFKTKWAHSIATFAQQLDVTQNYTIVFLSGDTSISELINNLPSVITTIEERKTIKIIPIAMGSANALANSIGFGNPVETFDSFLRGMKHTAPFPLYRVIFPNEKQIIFFIIFSMGFHANLLHLCTLDPKYSCLGVERFQLASTEILDNYNLNLTLEIKLTSKTIVSQFAYFALINTPRLEEKYIPSPQSDPFMSQLHILGYSSELSSKELKDSILKGYTLMQGDNVSGQGIVYEPVTDDFDIIIKAEVQRDPKYMLDICCDGILDNLNDMSSEVLKVIKIKFLKPNDLSFNLEIMKPEN
ncbi:similar to Kazachstania africana KAFR_0H00200 hypothetical protein [Maudiozyma barnettii]|uniref:DAGKc domain-containing protein n=1 Tax=Maudiozyma barnettii TaxID=61262 RepID=A0A8H2VIT9_9SACH|nr:uncharacterized protein KABA2_08S02068 [Kazachstania barnettii]CAB4256049.1 similar to Kazachstania africana KAFR_0H00200 hypothetical protein [Kazachstania barnettii]CAD1784657.1 similar to Kazachstania africana KAFR_0H00200 hypothetical protein [Kazachstania barnettii]